MKFKKTSGGLAAAAISVGLIIRKILKNKK
jgi:hypothetical protein